MTIGEAMRKTRKEKGLSMQRLAKKSGVSYSTLYSYETDKCFPSALNLICIADVLDVTLDELVGRKKE